MSAGAVALAIVVAFLVFLLILAGLALAATRAALLAITIKRPPKPKEPTP